MLALFLDYRGWLTTGVDYSTQSSYLLPTPVTEEQ